MLNSSALPACETRWLPASVFPPAPHPLIVRLRLLPLLLLTMLVPCSVQAAAPVTVYVDLHVISFGNYDVNKGTYTVDFYLHLWYDAQHAGTVDVSRFEFGNGRAASKELQSDDTNPATGVRDLWYRIQANLYTPPHFENYPYDTQHVTIEIENVANTTSELAFQVFAAPRASPDVVVPGWRINNVNAQIDDHHYDFSQGAETYSRYTYSLELSRDPTPQTLRSFLPPLAFMIVSGLSFFLHPSKITQRLGLGTSMLISAVGFHISQTVSLPALGRLTFFDQVMLSAYAFLAASLVVTTIIAYNEDFRKDPKRSQSANVQGAWLSIALPFVVFAALHFL